MLTSQMLDPALPQFGALPPAMRTHNLAEARSHLDRVFTRHELTAATPANISFEHRYAAVGDIAVNILGYGTDVEISTPALPDFYLFQVTLAGDVNIRSAGYDIPLPTGSVFVMNPGQSYRKHWGKESRQLILKLPQHAVERQARNDLESDRIQSVRFSPVVMNGAREAFSLVRYVGTICADLTDPNGIASNAAVRKTIESSILSAILATLANDHTDEFQLTALPAMPRYVRRAEAYLREHFSKPVSLSALAMAAGVSTRTLQSGFQRYRNTTPSRLLRDVRLDRVRAQILKGNASVTEAAFDAGFQHLGRFARSYAERFGETPSETLRQRLNRKN
jgi:AraC-like DNA-binding protein